LGTALFDLRGVDKHREDVVQKGGLIRGPGVTVGENLGQIRVKGALKAGVFRDAHIVKKKDSFKDTDEDKVTRETEAARDPALTDRVGVVGLLIIHQLFESVRRCGRRREAVFIGGSYNKRFAIHRKKEEGIGIRRRTYNGMLRRPWLHAIGARQNY
jgi:hypothetical protein